MPINDAEIPDESRPTRARGLKHPRSAKKSLKAIVAPHAGAWIETSAVPFASMFQLSRAPRGRVD